MFIDGNSTNSDAKNEVDSFDVLTNSTSIWLTDSPNVNRIE